MDPESFCWFKFSSKTQLEGSHANSPELYCFVLHPNPHQLSSCLIAHTKGWLGISATQAQVSVWTPVRPFDTVVKCPTCQINHPACLDCLFEILQKGNPSDVSEYGENRNVLNQHSQSLKELRLEHKLPEMVYNLTLFLLKESLHPVPSLEILVSLWWWS